MSCSLDKVEHLAKSSNVVNRFGDLYNASSDAVIKFKRFSKEIKEIAINKFGKLPDDLANPMRLEGIKVKYNKSFFNWVDSMNDKKAVTNKVYDSVPLLSDKMNLTPAKGRSLYFQYRMNETSEMGSMADVLGFKKFVRDNNANNQTSFKKASTEETVVSRDVIVKIADFFKNKLGTEYKIVSSDEARALVGKKDYNGRDPFFHSDGKVYMVEGNFTLETPIHEFSHPFVRAIAKRNPALFEKICKDILTTDEGEAIEALVKDLYPEHIDAKTGNLNLAGYEELAVRSLTELAKKNINPKTGKPFLEAVKRLLLQFKQMFRDVFGRNVKVSELNEKTTLQELADMLTISTGKIDTTSLKGKTYGEYQYVKGMPFQESTIQKMSNNEQSITIRQDNHKSGIYTINGEEYHIENLGYKNADDFANKEALKRDFKGKSYIPGKFKHIDEFFNGKQNLYVYQITKISDNMKDQSVTFKKSLELKSEKSEESKNKKVSSITENLRNIIKRQKAIYKQKANSKKFIDELTQLEKILDENENEVDSLMSFVETSNMYINSLYNRFLKLKDVVESGEEMSPKERNDALNLIDKIRELNSSYNILLDIKQVLYEDKSSPINHDFKLLTEANDRRERLIMEYEEVGKNLITDWLYSEAVDVNEKLAKAGKDKFILSKEKIRSEIDLASSDINVFQGMFDSAISSKDPITALAAKAIKRAMYEASMEDYEAFEELVGSFEENNITNQSKYQHEIEINNRVKNEAGEYVSQKQKVKALITKFRDDLFDNAKSDFFKSIGEKPLEGTKEAKEWAKKVSAWFKENTQIRPDVAEVVERRRAEMSPEDFNNWFSENTKELENTVYMDGYTKADLMRAENPRSVAGSTRESVYLYSGEFVLPSNKYLNKRYEDLKSDKFYQELLKQYAKANDQLPANHRLRYGMLPQVIKESRDKSLSERISRENLSESINVKAHDVRYKVQTLSGEEYQSVPIRYTTVLDQSLVSDNLVESILMFSQMSNNYKHMTEIKANVDLVASFVAKRAVIETNGAGKKIIDSITGLARVKDTADAKRVNERLKNFIDSAFYGNNDIKSSVNLFGKEIDVNKVAGKVQYLTALSKMAANLASGISNSTWGNYQTYAQSIGGKNYTGKQWLEANGHYIKNIPMYMADIGRTVGKSKDNQLAEIFDAIQGEFRDEYGRLVGGGRARRLFTTSSLFFVNNGTEHQIQITSMIAMMKAKKVKTKSGAEISLYDAYEMKGNRLRLRDDVIFSDNEKFSFMNEIHSINKRLHGVYNEFDKGEIQRQWYGKLAIMFRKHVYKGIVQRYGKETLDVELGDTVEGYYRTFFNKFAEDFKAYGVSGILNYKNYSDEQKTAFKKTMLDTVMLIGAMLVGSAIAGAGEKDKKKKNWFQNEMLLQLRRFQGDIAFYTFASKDTWRILNNPTVTQSTISEVYDFLSQMTNPTERYKRKTGMFKKGDLKIKARLYKAVPVLRSLLNFMTPEDQLQVFKK